MWPQIILYHVYNKTDYYRFINAFINYENLIFVNLNNKRREKRNLKLMLIDYKFNTIHHLTKQKHLYNHKSNVFAEIYGIFDAELIKSQFTFIDL